MLKGKSKPFIGFLQATGLVLYIILVSTFLRNIPNIFNNDSFEYMAPVIMLLLFIVSAVISALIVLWNAGVLFWEKKYTEAFTLLKWTIASLIIYFLSFVAIIILNQ